MSPVAGREDPPGERIARGVLEITCLRVPGWPGLQEYRAFRLAEG